MKRILLALLAVLGAASFGRAQTDIVTGHVQFPSGGAADSSSVCFSLQNFKPNVPRILNTTTIIQQQNWCIAPAADGSYSTSLIGNDHISPAGTYWRVDFLWNGIQQSSANFLVNSTPFNLDTATPLNQIPVAGPNQVITQAFSCPQVIASTTWTCTHNFNDTNVQVQTFDSTGKLIYPDTVVDTSPNVVTITFVTAQAGLAVVFHAGSISIATNQPNAVLQNPTGAQGIAGVLNVSATTTFTGVLQCKTLENVQCVDYTLSRGGVDIGDEINKAYAALPAGGGMIYVAPKPDGTCYSFSTGILFIVANKYPLLEGLGSAGVAGLSTPQGCLNYIPTSGAAITMDYATATGSPDSSVHGIRNLFLVNNNCFTFGGACGGTAIAVDTGMTNQGTYEAHFDNISIEGFPVGYRNLNNTSIGVVWNNPQFFQNGAAVLLDSATPISFNYGTYAGNNAIFKTNGANSNPGIWGHFMDMFNNKTVLDATATSSVGGGFNCTFCHFEASNSAQTPFIQGPLDYILFGGGMEIDNAGGTSSSFVVASGNYFYTQGIQFLSTATTTTILTANGSVKGLLNGQFFGSNFGSFVNGTNASRIDIQLRGAGANSDTSLFTEPTTFVNPVTFSSPIPSPTLTTPTLSSPTINGTATGTALQGTDSKLLTSGTVSGTGAALCTDANGGATTTGCPVFPTVQAAVNSSVCTTGTAAGSSCTTTVSWPSNFADTNYRASCSGVGPTQFPFYTGITSKAVGSVTVQITNGTASEAQASTFSSIECIGIHP